jgi:hypothetical protein
MLIVIKEGDSVGRNSGPRGYPFLDMRNCMDYVEMNNKFITLLNKFLNNQPIYLLPTWHINCISY